MKNIISKFAISLLIGGLVLVVVPPARAWAPVADFITGGGWFIIQNQCPTSSGFCSAAPIPPGCASIGARANFGWHGGVKNGQFWGNGNYLDHGCGLHVHNELVRDYNCISTNSIPWPNCAPATTHKDTGTREICGNARTNVAGPVFYRVRMNDTEPESAKQDKFGIMLFDQNFNEVYLAQGIPLSGGNIELHKGNPSNVVPASSEFFCDFLRGRTIVDFDSRLN